MQVQTRWVDLPAETGRMAMYVAEPIEAGPHPGIVAFHAVLGLTEVWRDIAEEIASHGYVVALPDTYHRLGYRLEFPRWPEQRDEAFAASASTSYVTWAQDSRSALNYLRTLPTVDPERLGTYGHCYGGAVAYVAAAYNKDVKSVLMVCPSSMISRAVTPAAPQPPFQLATQLNASVLCLSGSADLNPSPADVQVMAATMARAGRPFEYHIYNGDPPAGHAFFERDLPMYNKGAVEWAWPLKLDFLQRSLKT